LFLKSPPQLILASTSRYRRELLERLQLPFSCIAPGIDETAADGEKALALVARLAHAKAAAVASQHPHAWVIGSDQVAVHNNSAGVESILGKPGTAARCIQQLQQCSGHALSFITAVTFVRQELNERHEFIDTTRVRYRTLDQATIERYVAREQPFDCAGGFKSEALGITLCESIESDDPTGLIGLPLIKLSALLRAAGYELP
jgi:septum formation protein